MYFLHQGFLRFAVSLSASPDFDPVPALATRSPAVPAAEDCFAAGSRGCERHAGACRQGQTGGQGERHARPESGEEKMMHRGRSLTPSSA